MQPAKKRKLGELLIELGVITPEQLQEAMEYQRASGHKLGTCLMALGFVDEKDLIPVLTSKTELQSYMIGSQDIPLNVRSLIPVKKAFEWEVIPIKVTVENGRKYLMLGMTDPSNAEVTVEVQFLTNHTVIPVFVGLKDMQAAYERIYGKRMDLIRKDVSKVTQPGTTTAGRAELGTEQPPNKEEITLNTEDPNIEIVGMSTWNQGVRVREKRKRILTQEMVPDLSKATPEDVAELFDRVANIDRKLDELLKLFKNKEV